MMRERFHQEMENLKNELERMGNLAIAMLCDAVEAFKTHDTKLADAVISRKTQLREFNRKIDEGALTTIARFQPMAKDLRTLGFIIKTTTYLYRVGRYGKDIAAVTKELSKEQHISKLVSIPYMAEKAASMLKDALKAFRTEDLSLIQDFKERDDELDSLRYSIFRECVSYMLEDPRKISLCAHYIMVARYLERCGDHACKIAEKVHYMITGEFKVIK
ncbi:MAG: phosphate transport system regulatory protein PhoU [Thermoplasmata archaeon]|nr:MAG: phosphate transport system regulatory protein PhoU [Thermoplasmata archaeon]